MPPNLTWVANCKPKSLTSPRKRGWWREDREEREGGREGGKEEGREGRIGGGREGGSATKHQATLASAFQSPPKLPIQNHNKFNNWQCITIPGAKGAQ